MRPTTPATNAHSEPEGAISYIRSLDGVRGIAILLVLWFHAPVILGLGPIWRDSLFWHLSMGGGMGVDLFFGVSGFLITTILLKTRGQAHSFRNFWARRALRIFPLHYLYLLVLVVIAQVMPSLTAGEVAVEGAMWLPYFLYVGNVAILLMGNVGAALVILWSLAIEEQFYLVWPFVVSRLPPAEVAKFCIAGIALSPLIRLGAQYGEPSVQTAFYFTLCRVDPIFWGALLAIACRDAAWRQRLERWAPKLPIPILLTTLGLLYWVGAAEFQIDLAFDVVGRTIAAATVAATVALALFGGPWTRRVLETPVLVWIGKKCYGIYIWHVIIGFALAAWLGPKLTDLGPVVATTAWALITFAFAWVSWTIFEQPILRLKRHFRYSQPD